MNRRIRIFFSTFTLLFLFLVLTTIGMAKPPSFTPDRVLVKFKSGADIANIHAANGTRTLRVIPGINV
ncbi:hypothetical protein FJZ33_13245, partial [Candidatus Poribacteria bacterium]|nr:hypothetical protein [Candidatus Poribacteria bacterium]